MFTGRHLLVEVSLGDSNKMGVHGGHDSDEGGLSSECRKHTTKLTWTSHIEQVLVEEGRREGGREGGKEGEKRKSKSHFGQIITLSVYLCLRLFSVSKNLQPPASYEVYTAFLVMEREEGQGREESQKLSEKKNTQERGKEMKKGELTMSPSNPRTESAGTSISWIRPFSNVSS